MVATCDPREKTARELAELMVGAGADPAGAGRRATPGPVALEVEGLSVASPNPFGTSLKEVGFQVRQGEILGIAGVAGNGQDELLGALSGEIALGAGNGADLPARRSARLGPAERRRLGLVSAPEERLGHAAAPDMSLTENAFLSGAVRRGPGPARVHRLGRGAGLRRARWWRSFDVRTPGIGVAARALSGGNLQKFVIGREILQAPDGDRGEPADLGGRCGGGGGDPAGAAGPRGGRARRWW